jgi:hypothetical protein
MVKNRQKGITKAYRNDKKDVDTSGSGGMMVLLSSIISAGPLMV